jgi:hypothetical protein
VHIFHVRLKIKPGSRLQLRPGIFYCPAAGSLTPQRLRLPLVREISPLTVDMRTGSLFLLSPVKHFYLSDESRSRATRTEGRIETVAAIFF